MGAGTTVRKILMEDAAVVALVGTRVYPKLLPQSPTYPAITYQRISRAPVTDHLRAPGTMARPRVQLDVWAKSDAEALALADEVRRCLNGFVGAVEGEGYVHRIALENEQDMYDAEMLLHRTSADYYVWHEE